MLTRRGFFLGLIAAPAVVKVTSLMPLRGVVLPTAEESIAIAGSFGGSLRREQVNKLIEGLKVSGLWDKMEHLWLFKADSEEEALKDLRI